MCHNEGLKVRATKLHRVHHLGYHTQQSKMHDGHEFVCCCTNHASTYTPVATGQVYCHSTKYKYFAGLVSLFALQHHTLPKGADPDIWYNWTKLLTLLSCVCEPLADTLSSFS